MRPIAGTPLTRVWTHHPIGAGVDEPHRSSADDEELFSDVDAGAAHNAVALARLAPTLGGVGFANNGSVAGKAIAHPKSTLVLAELEVGLGDGFAGVGNNNELVEVLTRLRHGVAAEQPGAVHRDALPRRELQHKTFAVLAARHNPGALKVVEVVFGRVSGNDGDRGRGGGGGRNGDSRHGRLANGGHRRRDDNRVRARGRRPNSSGGLHN